MTEINVSVDRLGEKTWDLGRQGEHLARRMSIDVSAWLQQYPGAQARLVIQKQDGTAPYMAETTVSDGRLLWPIKSHDTARHGTLLMQVCLMGAGGEVVKSAIGFGRVRESILGTPEETEPGGDGYAITYDQRNRSVADYLDNTVYTDTPGSMVDKYVEQETPYNKAYPAGVSVDAGPGVLHQADYTAAVEGSAATLYNAEPGRMTPFAIVQSDAVKAAGCLHPTGALRTARASSTSEIWAAGTAMVERSSTA